MRYPYYTHNLTITIAVHNIVDELNPHATAGAVLRHVRAHIIKQYRNKRSHRSARHNVYREALAYHARGQP